MNKLNLREVDNVSKTALVVLAAIVGYFSVFLIANAFFIPKQTPMTRMMNEMMGTNIMNFSATNSAMINLISLVLAAGLAFLVSLYLFRRQLKDKEYTILRKALSNDEKAILDEIKKAGEITQDSLRFRLNWSKAKISTILTNLDKINLIQRERQGKTYKVFLSKK